MNVASPSHVSFEDFLVGVTPGDVKHEWCDGVVYAMPRGSPEHARLTMRIARAIGAALEQECEVYSSDLMLYVETAKLSTYADVSVVCGSVETKTVRKNGEYVLVSQDARCIEVYRRQGREGSWQCEIGGPGAKVTIHGKTIDVDAIYG